MATAVVTKTDVEKFFVICEDARMCYMHYRALFEPDDHRTVFDATAPIFFRDISLILKKYLILEVCKLGDPACQHGNVNLSIDFFIKCFDFSTAPTEFDQLKHRATKLRPFIRKLKPARNKLLSHSDRLIITSETRGLGGADTDEWDCFWLDLEAFVEVLCKQYLGGPRPFRDGAYADARILVEALQQQIG
jgi:hypothetical protein